MITAFQNVADALRALQADARGWPPPRPPRSHGQSLELIRKQYTAGRRELVAGADRAAGLPSRADHLGLARATQYADTAALFVALGGGWWNRNDVAPAPPETDPLKFL